MYGASELSARYRAGGVGSDEGVHFGKQVGADLDEGRGGTLAHEVVFVLVRCFTELAAVRLETVFGMGSALSSALRTVRYSAVRTDPHFVPHRDIVRTLDAACRNSQAGSETVVRVSPRQQHFNIAHSNYIFARPSEYDEYIR